MEKRIFNKYKDEKIPPGTAEDDKKAIQERNAEKKKMRTLQATLVDQSNLPNVFGFKKEYLGNNECFLSIKWPMSNVS